MPSSFAVPGLSSKSSDVLSPDAPLTPRAKRDSFQLAPRRIVGRRWQTAVVIVSTSCTVLGFGACKRDDQSSQPPDANSAAESSVEAKEEAAEPKVDTPEPMPSPVERPANLMVAARIQSLETVVDRLLGWSEVSVDWRAIMRAQLPELERSIDMKAPVTLGITVEATPEGAKVWRGAMSLGIADRSAAETFVGSKGWELVDVETQAGRASEFRPRPDVLCRLGLGRGPARHRLSCAQGSQAAADLDLLGGYLTRGDIVEHSDRPGVYVDGDLQTLARAYAAELDTGAAAAEPGLMALLAGVPDERMKSALEVAGRALLAELIKLRSEARSMSLALVVDEARNGLSLETDARLAPVGEPSFFIRAMDGMRTRASVAPAWFWQTPAEVTSAAWMVGGAPELMAQPLGGVGELLASGLGVVGVSSKRADALGSAVAGLGEMSQMVMVQFPRTRAERDMRAATAGLRARSSELGAAMAAMIDASGTAWAIGSGGSAFAKVVDASVALLRDRSARSAFRRHDLLGVLGELWPRVQTRAVPKSYGLPAGSRVISLAFSRNVQSKAVAKRVANQQGGKGSKKGNTRPNASEKLKDLQISLLEVPHDRASYYLVGVDDKELAARAQSLLGNAGEGTKTLAQRTDLGHLREFSAGSAGYFDAGWLLGNLAGGLGSGQGSEVIRSMSQRVLAGGQNPVFFDLRTDARGEERSTGLRVLIPAASLRSLVLASPLVQPQAQPASGG